MASHAAHYWARYASFAQTSKGLMQMMVRFLEEESTFQLWGRLYQPDQPGVNEPVALMSSRLYKIAFVGLALLAHEFIDKGADVNAQVGLYGNALQAACIDGYRNIEVVELLITKGADINAQGGYYGTALHAACAFNHREIAELLLNKGADFDVQGGFFGDALQVAYTRGHHKIVEMPRSKGVIKMPSKRPSSLTPTSPTKKLCPGDESSDDFQQAID